MISLGNQEGRYRVRPFPVTLDHVSQHSSPDQFGKLASLIDHTALKPEVDETAINKLCDEAVQHGFASVCVNPYWVKRCAAQLASAMVQVCTVVGFPLGANCRSIKQAEAERALDEVATELDVVQNLGALRSGSYNDVEGELMDLASLAHRSDAILKVILETSSLTDAEKSTAAQLAVRAGADFVKTSTGFSTGGATIADVALLRKVVGPRLGVKASGGIKTLATMQDMLQAGASRIGTSSGVAIMLEAQDRAAGKMVAKQSGRQHGFQY